MINKQVSPEIHALTLLYGQMLEEMHKCCEEERNVLQQLELLFEVAENHKLMLCERMRNYHFKNDEEQILYFRRIKPLFFSEIHFHSYCYHTELFLADCYSAVEKDNFLCRQSRRLGRFIQEHPDFYQCISTPACEQSQLHWFTTPRQTEIGCKHPPSTKGEQLMATWMALNRFQAWLRKKMKND